MSMAARAAKLIDETVERFDDWQNYVTLIGTIYDKATRATFQRERPAYNDQQIEGIFDEDDMGALLVTALPEQSMQKGFEVRTGNADEQTAINLALDAMGCEGHLLESWIWEAVYGGAAIFLNADDGQAPDQPLNLDNVQSFRSMASVDRRALRVKSVYLDVLNPKFGKPELFALRNNDRIEGPGSSSAEETIIHETRLIVFRGGRVSNGQRRRNGGWGASKLERSMKALRLFDTNWQSVQHLMQDASQGVFSMKNLIKTLSSPERKYALERMRQVNLSRSVARALILDADNEKFERKDTNMSGLPELLDRSAQRLSASGRIPVSVLMGREPAGLNATGEMDIRAWAETCSNAQRMGIAPKVRRIVTVLCAAKDGPTKGKQPEKIDVYFPPVITPTPSELGAIRLQHAQIDASRIQTQQLAPEQVITARYPAEGYQDDPNFDVSHLANRLEVLARESETGDDMPPARTLPEPDDGTTALEPASGPQDPAADPNAKDPAAALNGAQVASLLGIVQQVAQRQIPRETGIALITSAFPITTEAAEKLMGAVGTTFFVAPQGSSGQP